MVIEEPSLEFSPEVVALLRSAGWHEGRRIDLTLWDQEEVRPFGVARDILSEFGGLHIGDTGPGVDMARSDVDLRHDAILSFWDHFRERERQVGCRVYPLGSVHHAHGEILISESGRVYLDSCVHELFECVGQTFSEGLERLLLGKHPRPDEPGP